MALGGAPRVGTFDVYESVDAVMTSVGRPRNAGNDEAAKLRPHWIDK